MIPVFVVYLFTVKSSATEVRCMMPLPWEVLTCKQQILRDMKKRLGSQVDVEPKIGVVFIPPKWMVKIMENLIKMDDLGGKPTIFGNIQVTSEFRGYKVIPQGMNGKPGLGYLGNLAHSSGFGCVYVPFFGEVLNIICISYKMFMSTFPLRIVINQLLQSDLLIPQMEVTFSALKRSRLWVQTRSRLEEPGRYLENYWVFYM